MTVSEFEVVEVVNAVWQSMLGMEAYDLGPEAELDEGPFITATVLITVVSILLYTLVTTVERLVLDRYAPQAAR